MQETKNRPYAGQTWTWDLFAETHVSFLALIERDLHADAKEQGVPMGPIEFWVNEEKQLKGFYMGDTTSLAYEGWTLLGTL